MHRVLRTEQVCVSGCFNAEFLAQLSMNLKRINVSDLTRLALCDLHVYHTRGIHVHLLCTHTMCLKKFCWGGGGGHFSMCVIRVQGNHMVH